MGRGVRDGAADSAIRRSSRDPHFPSLLVSLSLFLSSFLSLSPSLHPPFFSPLLLFVLSLVQIHSLQFHLLIRDDDSLSIYFYLPTLSLLSLNHADSSLPPYLAVRFFPPDPVHGKHRIMETAFAWL